MLQCDSVLGGSFRHFPAKIGVFSLIFSHDLVISNEAIALVVLPHQKRETSI